MARKTEKKASEVVAQEEKTVRLPKAAEPFVPPPMDPEDVTTELDEAAEILEGPDAEALARIQEKANQTLIGLNAKTVDKPHTLTADDIKQMEARLDLLTTRCNSSTQYTEGQYWTWKYEINAIKAGVWYPSIAIPANPKQATLKGIMM